MLSAKQRNKIEARRMVTSELKAKLTETNITADDLVIRGDCSWSTARVALEDYVSNHPEVLVGYESGSDRRVLGTVVKRTSDTMTLSDGSIIRWHESKMSYIHKGTRYVTFNAVEYIDPSF